MHIASIWDADRVISAILCKGIYWVYAQRYPWSEVKVSGLVFVTITWISFVLVCGWHSHTLGHLASYLDLLGWNYYILFWGQILNWRWITMPCTMVYPGDHGPNFGSSGLTSLVTLLVFILEGSLPTHLHMGLKRRYADWVFCKWFCLHRGWDIGYSARHQTTL